ncbi:N/A [soil metagenome]
MRVDRAAPSRRSVALTGAGLWLLVVAPMGLLVGLRWAPLLAADQRVVEGLHLRGWVPVSELVTQAGTTWFRLLVLAPVAVWAWRSGRARLGWYVVVAAALIGPVTSGLKVAVGRDRPELIDPMFFAQDLSHPSGHASGIATLVGVLLVTGLRPRSPRSRRWWIAAAVATVALVGLTRVVLGVHFPSDVLAGWALGAGWVLVLAAAFDVLPRRPVNDQVT